jgi:hypothetical protein
MLCQKNTKITLPSGWLLSIDCTSVQYNNGLVRDPIIKIEMGLIFHPNCHQFDDVVSKGNQSSNKLCSSLWVKSRLWFSTRLG